jgi:hypothetical protein
VTHKIKPCPFCSEGENLEVDSNDCVDYVFVNCHTCGAEGPKVRGISDMVPFVFGLEEAAIIAWNNAPRSKKTHCPALLYTPHEDCIECECWCEDRAGNVGCARLRDQAECIHDVSLHGRGDQ